jgi:hypothetical protein
MSFVRAGLGVAIVPQSGVMRCGVLDLLDAAVRNGADLVGGIDPLEIDRDRAHALPEGKCLHNPGRLSAS